MNSDRDDQIIKSVGALGTLERATEFQTFLLLANFVFALNLALGFVHNNNLINFSWQYAKENVPIGQVLIFVMIFSLYMSCIVGILRSFTDQIVSYPVIIFVSFLKDNFSEDNKSRFDRPMDMVRPYDLCRAARSDGGEDYLVQYKEYRVKKDENDAMASRTATLSFALLVLLALDAILLHTNSLSVVIVQGLNSVCDYLGNSIAMLVVAVLLMTWLYRFIEDTSSREWVVNPRLHEKLAAADRHRRDEER